MNININTKNEMHNEDLQLMTKALKNGGGCLVTTFTSLAALSPAWTSPSMYPDHWVAVSVPAKYKLPSGLLISLRTTNICLSCEQGKKNFLWDL